MNFFSKLSLSSSILLVLVLVLLSCFIGNSQANLPSDSLHTYHHSPLLHSGGDKYRWYLTDEDVNNTDWVDGPPNYDVVNKLFQQGQTQVWPPGSLEEYVQNFIKTWEMELVNKANPDQFKTLDPNKFVISTNGGRVFNLSETGAIGGSYNIFLQTSLPPELRYYDPDKETYNSSQTAFKTVFPRGFAFEILQVYSPPPNMCYKFRHWGYMEGPFKGHAPTGELVEFFGISSVKVRLNQESRVVSVENFFDRGQLLAPLMKGDIIPDDHDHDHVSLSSAIRKGKTSASAGCPFNMGA